MVIPREIFQRLRMREGDFVAFAQKDNGVLIKPKRLVDPDDVLTPAEAALLKKAEREMRQGKYVTLEQLHHDLARERSPRRGKQLEAIPPDRRPAKRAHLQVNS